MAGTYNVIGYQQITSLSSSATLTIPQGANRALIQAETQDVRWRGDGENPTASVGMVLSAGDTIVYDGALSGLRFIEVTASAKLNVTYLS